VRFGFIRPVHRSQFSQIAGCGVNPCIAAGRRIYDPGYFLGRIRVVNSGEFHRTYRSVALENLGSRRFCILCPTLARLAAGACGRTSPSRLTRAGLELHTRAARGGTRADSERARHFPSPSHEMSRIRLLA
jgi:hypothetical protein